MCQDNGERTFCVGNTQRAYTFNTWYLRIVLRNPKNLERYHFVIVHALPKFGHLGGVLGVDPLRHDALKFIRRWDCNG